METATGVPVWEYMAQNPEFSNRFNMAMASDSRILMEVLGKECGGVFNGVGSIVDVGAGTGESAMTIARTFPHIKCTVFDLPHVVATVPHTMDLDFVSGDMFETIPKAKAVFLKVIYFKFAITMRTSLGVATDRVGFSTAENISDQLKRCF